jgi:hypothetical protein
VARYEDQRHAGEQDVERDLVRRLLPLGAFDERDHPVDECGAGRRRDANADPVGQHLRATRHRRAVAAGFADDRGGFAGDGRLVDGGDALDHFTVRRDDVAGFDQHEVADLEAGAGNHAVAAAIVGGQKLGLRFGARLAQRIRLRLAAAFGDGLGEVGEQHGEPEPEIDLEREAEIAVAHDQVADEEDGGQHRHRGDDEHDGVLGKRLRVQLP